MNYHGRPMHCARRMCLNGRDYRKHSGTYSQRLRCMACHKVIRVRVDQAGNLACATL